MARDGTPFFTRGYRVKKVKKHGFLVKNKRFCPQISLWRGDGTLPRFRTRVYCKNMSKKHLKTLFLHHFCFICILKVFRYKWDSYQDVMYEGKKNGILIRFSCIKENYFKNNLYFVS